jgi:hypothetical protein
LRIAYDNIIDDLLASSITALTTATGYTVMDVQDQRLSTRWVSSTSTTQSITITLPTLSEYPDSTTGTTAIYHFESTTEGFIASGGIATTTTIIGCISLTATTANSSIQHSGLTIASGADIYIKARSSAGLATTLTILRGASTVTTITGMTTSFTILKAIISGGATATTLSIVGNNAASSGSVFDIDWAYAGTGAYTSTLADLSGNGNTLNIFGSTPIAGSSGTVLSRDGINDYERTTNVLASVPDVWHYHEEFPNGHAQTADYQAFMNYKIASTTLGYFVVYHKASSDNIYLNYCNGSTAGTIDMASFFTGFSSTRIVIDIIINWLTGVILIYRNGSYFGTATMTTPVKPTAGSYLYFGSYQGTSYPCAGVCDRRRLYSRALSANEILNLYNNERFVSESFGLVGHWKVDDGLEINTAAILGHNLLSGTTAKIQATNNNSDWTSPEINTQLVVNDSMILNFATTQSVYKYWKFSTTGQASIEIGRLWLGSYITIDPSSLLDFKVSKKRSDNVSHGRNRQKWASIGIGWRKFEFSFPPTNETMLYLIQLLYDAVGNHSSFLFCNLDVLREWALTEPCYVSIIGDLGFNHLERFKYEYSLLLEEEK